MTANEWFEESLTFDTPSVKEPKGDDLANGLENAFNNLQSPGAGGDSDKEIPTFDKKHDWVQKILIKSRYLEENTKRPDGKPMDETELVSKIRAQWREHNLHESTEGWKTDHDRWHIKVKSKKVDSQRPQSEIGWWFEIIKGTGSPKFQQFIDGAVSIGKLQTGNIWVITAEDVEDIIPI